MSLHLTVYTVPFSTETDLVLAQIAQAGLPCTVIDATTPGGAEQLVAALHFDRLPIVTAGTAVWCGHRPELVDAAASVAPDPYVVPVDPMDDLQCGSCQ